jgi:hypothetical protein
MDNLARELISDLHASLLKGKGIFIRKKFWVLTKSVCGSFRRFRELHLNLGKCRVSGIPVMLLPQ